MFQEIKLKYIAYQMIFPIFYTCYLMYLGYAYRIEEYVLYLQQHKSLSSKFECSIPIGLMGGFGMFTYTGYVLYLLIIGIYIYAAYELKKKGGSKDSNV